MRTLHEFTCLVASVSMMLHDGRHKGAFHTTLFSFVGVGRSHFSHVGLEVDNSSVDNVL